MKYCEKVCSKQFSDISSQKAFLKASKWYYDYFFTNSDKFHDISVSYEKVKSDELITIKATIWATLEESQIMSDNCKICKEVHNLFYVNDSYNCSSCTINAYRSRLTEKIVVKCNFYKDIIRRIK